MEDWLIWTNKTFWSAFSVSDFIWIVDKFCVSFNINMSLSTMVYSYNRTNNASARLSNWIVYKYKIKIDFFNEFCLQDDRWKNRLSM